MTTIHAGTFCRGEGRGYLELIFEDAANIDTNRFIALAVLNDGETIPCPLYWPDETETAWRNSVTRRAVLVFPLLDGAGMTLTVSYGTTRNMRCSRIRSTCSSPRSARD